MAVRVSLFGLYCLVPGAPVVTRRDLKRAGLAGYIIYLSPFESIREATSGLSGGDISLGLPVYWKPKSGVPMVIITEG